MLFIRRTVVSVHGRRRHAPFALVHRLADLRPDCDAARIRRRAASLPAKSSRRSRRSSNRATYPDNRSCWPPRQLGQRLLLGGLRSSTTAVRMSCSIAFSISCTRSSALAFAGPPNAHFDILLSQRLAQLVIGFFHAALPPRLDFFRARERLAEEIEVLVDKAFGSAMAVSSRTRQVRYVFRSSRLV